MHLTCLEHSSSALIFPQYLYCSIVPKRKPNYFFYARYFEIRNLHALQLQLSCQSKEKVQMRANPHFNEGLSHYLRLCLRIICSLCSSGNNLLFQPYTSAPRNHKRNRMGWEICSGMGLGFDSLRKVTHKKIEFLAFLASMPIFPHPPKFFHHNLGFRDISDNRA